MMRFRGFGCVLLMALAAGTAAALPKEVPQKRGDFAFHYAPRYTAAELAWYGRFNIVVPGSFLPPEQVTALHRAGSKLLYYEWLVAFYLAPTQGADRWERRLLTEHPEWLLNPEKGLLGHAGSEVTPAYYYDPTVAGLREWRVAHLIRQAREHQYDGIFFDTTGFGSVHPEAQATFKQRHPDEEYDAAIAQFLALLRREAPDLILFTNQGYRNAPHYLPYADFDLSESYMTTSGGPTAEVYLQERGRQRITETYVHPWYRPENLWDSVAHYCEVLIDAPLRQGGYRTRICHLNYGQPRYQPTGKQVEVDGVKQPVYREVLDREALHYGVAAALLLGQSSYYEAGPGIPRDEVYFVDLGKPLGARYTYDRQRGIAWRRFTRGLVVVNDSGRPVKLAVGKQLVPAGVTRLWDVYAGREVAGFATHRTLTLPTSRYQATRRTEPTGRVFVYLNQAAARK
ncbi:MAG: hypothetical protein GX774_19995 [Armatimonadetes bacterium]|nr:hypothetical protein [Armatimonadota bacterium]